MTEKKLATESFKSFSQILKFRSCPKKWSHKYLLRKKVETVTKNMQFGSDIHKIYENFCRGSVDFETSIQKVPNREQFSKFAEEFKNLIEGGYTAYPEYKIKCELFGILFTGYIDLLLVNEKEGKAAIYEYKTGKHYSYHDMQVKIYAFCALQSFPKIEEIKITLLGIGKKPFRIESYFKDDLRLDDSVVNSLFEIENSCKNFDASGIINEEIKKSWECNNCLIKCVNNGNISLRA